MFTTTNSGSWLRGAQSEGPLVPCRTLGWKAPSRMLPHNWGTSGVNKAQILLASSAAHSREHWSHEAAASVVISKTCLPGKARLLVRKLSAKTATTIFLVFLQIKSQRPHNGNFKLTTQHPRSRCRDRGVEGPSTRRPGLSMSMKDRWVHPQPEALSSLFLSLWHQYKWAISRLPLIWALQKLTLLNWVRTQVVS